jgi:hypothetical protein
MTKNLFYLTFCAYARFLLLRLVMQISYPSKATC